MVELTEVIRTFLNSIVLSGNVLSFSDDGTNTTVLLENSYHLREGMELSIDGTQYYVYSVNAKEDTALIEGVLASAEKYIVPNPFFFHGSQYEAGKEYDLVQSKNRLPMFYMEKPIRERWFGRGSALATRPNFYFLLADEANYTDWLADDFVEKRTLGLKKLAWRIRQEANKYRLFGTIDEFDVEVLPKLGRYSSSGSEDSFLNENLTGLGFRATIPIRNCKC